MGKIFTFKKVKGRLLPEVVVVTASKVVAFKVVFFMVFVFLV